MSAVLDALHLELCFLGRGYLEKFKYDVRGNRSLLMTAENVKSYNDQEVIVPEWIG